MAIWNQPKSEAEDTGRGSWTVFDLGLERGGISRKCHCSSLTPNQHFIKIDIMFDFLCKTASQIWSSFAALQEQRIALAISFYKDDVIDEAEIVLQKIA